MPIPSRTPGDTFLLFGHFEFDFAPDLPLWVGPSICLDITPQDVLQDANPPGLADYVLPGYTFVSGIVNCCLRKPVSVALPERMSVPQALFLAVEAFRLAAPLQIRVAGQFELGNGDTLIENPALYQLRSTWSPQTDSDNRYSGEEVSAADRIARHIVAVGNHSRLTSARVLFGQVTVGMTSSLQMATMGLFAALEAMFVPTGSNKAECLATRVASFLERIPFPFNVAAWLKDEYRSRRHKLMHGVQDVLAWGWPPIDEEKLVALGRLHELVRLAILGLLSLPAEVIREHSTLTGQGFAA